MPSIALTKARILAERAKREWDAAKDLELSARRDYEHLQTLYLRQAEREGLCRYCLEPLSEGRHDHIVLGMG